jgi:hypothetical protein
MNRMKLSIPFLLAMSIKARPANRPSTFEVKHLWYPDRASIVLGTPRSSDTVLDTLKAVENCRKLLAQIRLYILDAANTEP